MRVDFYVLETASAAARLRLACRIAEKAYLASQSVLIWHTERRELDTVDQLLWTFADVSFVPHEWLEGAAAAQTPVLLGTTPPAAAVDVLINLDPSASLPPFLERIGRVAEVIDGEHSRRDAGRERFKAYRQMGISPDTHNLHAP